MNCIQLLFLVTALFSLSCFGLSYTQERYSTNPYSVRIVSRPGAFHTGFVRPVSTVPGSPVLISTWITDQSNVRVWSKVGVSDEVKFAFRADSNAKSYQLWTAFERSLPDAPPPTADVDITLSFDIGLDLFDPAEAVVHKVKPVADDLRYLEGVIAGMAKKYDVISKDEGILRDANESLNNRLSVFFTIATVSLVVLIAWQTVTMMRYFKSKKLID